MMTTSTTPKSATADAAAQASIGAAARELHLPTVRTEAARLADIADRERHTHLRYLAEVLAAEVDDRTETAPHPAHQRRQVPEAKTPGGLQHRCRPRYRTRHPGPPRRRAIHGRRRTGRAAR
jgi:hypothetical protein